MAVVGAGVVGASAAAALARYGLSVAVVTGGSAAGAISATAASGGLVRCYEPDPRVRALALRSHELLWGRPGRRRELSGHRVTGSLVVLTADEAEKADAVLDELRASGVRAHLLGPREVARRWPSLGTAGIAAALWEPSGGHAHPASTAALLRTEARRHGAAVHDTRALRLLRADDNGYVGPVTGGSAAGGPVTGGPVTGVVTADGELRARTVVLAAGTGTPALLPPEVRLATRTRRVRYTLVGWPRQATVPTIMDNVTGCWGRPYRGGALLVGRPVDEWDVHPAAGRDITEEQLRFIRDGATARWPAVATAPLRGARWGTDLYGETGPYLGPVDAVPGLILAAAWSGAGFKTAPAAGEAVLHHVLAQLDR